MFTQEQLWNRITSLENQREGANKELRQLSHYNVRLESALRYHSGVDLKEALRQYDEHVDVEDEAQRRNDLLGG